MIILDTSLLVYAHRSSFHEHESAKSVIEAACNDPRGAGVAIPSVLEFYGLVTNHKVFARPSTMDEAAEFIAQLELTGGVTLCHPHTGFYRRLAQLARDMHVSGARLFDLQIALIGLDNGATQVWTRDAGFIKVPGLDIVRPF